MILENEIYIDGRLSMRCKFENMTEPSTASMLVNGVQFHNIPLRPKEKMNYYESGIILEVQPTGIMNFYDKRSITLADPSILIDSL